LLLALFLLALISFVSFMVITVQPASADWNDDYPYSGGVMDARDSWGFLTRECTSFVAWRLIHNNGDTGFRGPVGNGAQDWGTVYANITNSTPAPGSVAWWSSGHVAWVESVRGSNVTIEEYDYNFNHSFNERTITASNPTG
jgi:surface antigen